MSIVNQNFKPVTDPNINSVFADMLPIVRANPQFLNAYLLTGSPTEKLAAAMIKDMPQTKQAPPTQAPAQSVIDRMAGESAGVAALQQPQMPNPQAGMQQQMPTQVAQAQPEMQPEMMMAQGGLAMLPLPDTMFNEDSYAGGGIIAFEDGGDVPRYDGRTGSLVKNNMTVASIEPQIAALTRQYTEAKEKFQTGKMSRDEYYPLAAKLKTQTDQLINSVSQPINLAQADIMAPAVPPAPMAQPTPAPMAQPTPAPAGLASIQPAVSQPEYLKNPVGKYFNPANIEKYDDTRVQTLLQDNPALSRDDIFKQQQEERGRYGIKNLADEQRAALAEDKAENEKFKSTIETDALLRAAAGFLGNTSQFFGPGAKASIEGYTTAKQEGRREYRANARDIRNLGFDIGRTDQAMRQAEMTGDQAMFNTQQTRRDSLLNRADDIQYKNTDSKNKLLTDGASAAAAYDMNVEVAGIKGRAAAEAARAKPTDLYNTAEDNASTRMKNLYPLGSQDPAFKKTREQLGTEALTQAYNAELKRYREEGIIAMARENGIDPSVILNAGTSPAPDKKADMATPSKNTIAGKVSNAPPVPADKSKLVKNMVYNTETRGDALWDGKQFVAQ